MSALLREPQKQVMTKQVPAQAAQLAQVADTRLGEVGAAHTEADCLSPEWSLCQSGLHLASVLGTRVHCGLFYLCLISLLCLPDACISWFVCMCLFYFHYLLILFLCF